MFAALSVSANGEGASQGAWQVYCETLRSALSETCRYGPTFEEMYQKMEERQRERQNQLRDQAAQGTVLEKVQQVSLKCQPLKPAAKFLFCGCRAPNLACTQLHEHVSGVNQSKLSWLHPLRSSRRDCDGDRAVSRVLHRILTLAMWNCRLLR